MDIPFKDPRAFTSQREHGRNSFKWENNEAPWNCFFVTVRFG